jgi:hypothetical protein
VKLLLQHQLLHRPKEHHQLLQLQQLQQLQLPVQELLRV